MAFTDERGAALVVALQTVAIVMALGAALVLLTTTESAIASNFRAGAEALYAADAALERALVDLRASADWTEILAGRERASVVDGPASGVRRLRDGRAIDLSAMVNLANCLKAAGCSASDVTMQTAERPWGANNPRWVAYMHGFLADAAAPVPVRSPFYVVVLAADDPSENDDDPERDGISGATAPNPGRGILLLRAESFGPGGAHRTIEATVGRVRRTEAGVEQLGPDLHVLAWREFY